ncbi:hypothetical protein [Curtobacterium sp. MCBD17_026]|uniref:hypothetical protein n=1 Tax=Curtobacterium sp. MCBD17_026 TaxID=2175621 RepID=UPI0011B5278B|nr:hypothetical protein [Curtobacterium sp. MCBD17_026]WIB72594.1 hypothetical protein DEI85_17540 [Curtobacterium sp. MCBD17_026]
MTLDQVLAASREDALTLGVHGDDPAARAERARAAAAVLDDYERVADSTRRLDPNGPGFREPFGTAAVLRHVGDLADVVNDAAFRWELTRAMERDEVGVREAIVSDADGVRVEQLAPGPWADGRVQDEVGRIRTVLVESGDCEQRRSLEQRMDDAYHLGFAERVDLGERYEYARDADRPAALHDVMRSKASAYAELDGITDVIRGELPFHDDPDDLASDVVPWDDGEELTRVTPAADAALVRAAHLAGQWGGIDPAADRLFAAIDRQTVSYQSWPRLNAGDDRGATSLHDERTVDAAERGLQRMDRDTVAAAIRATAAPAGSASFPRSAAADLNAAAQRPRETPARGGRHAGPPAMDGPER